MFSSALVAAVPASTRQTVISGLSRRRFLWTGITGAVAATTLGVAIPTHARAQTNLSPDDALRALLEGNKRYVEKHPTSLSQDMALLRQNTLQKQEPFAGVLSCADLRVPVELAFDQSIGQIFVTRVAGNVATPEIIASLEYGAAALGTQDNPGAGSWRLWRRQGNNGRQSRAGADQRFVCADPASGGRGGRQS